MENWVSDQLENDTWITFSDTGYISNALMMEYLLHFKRISGAGPDKPWRPLLLDGHESHQYEPFQLECFENHIHLQYFPSHETHALQPLDVGGFRLWKHQQNKALQKAVREYDFQYSHRSFLRDLTPFREKVFLKHTIINSFRDTGMWPIKSKNGLRMRKKYSGRNKKEGLKKHQLRRVDARKRKERAAGKVERYIFLLKLDLSSV